MTLIAWTRSAYPRFEMTTWTTLSHGFQKATLLVLDQTAKPVLSFIKRTKETIKIEGIFLASKGLGPMLSQEHATLVRGVELEGDR